MCFSGWLREEIFSHSVELVLYNVLEGSALNSLVWFSTNEVHVFGMLSPDIVSWFSIFTLPCTEVASGDWYPKNLMWRPWSSPALLVFWGLVTDLKRHPSLLMEIAVSPVLIHLLGLREGNRATAELGKIGWYWGWSYRATTTDRRGLICFICAVSICCICKVSTTVLPDKNLLGAELSNL